MTVRTFTQGRAAIITIRQIDSCPGFSPKTAYRAIDRWPFPSQITKDWEYRTMKCVSWAYAFALMSCICADHALAQGIRQPLSVRAAAFDYERYLQEEVASPSDAPAQAEVESPTAEPAQTAPAAPQAMNGSHSGGSCGCGSSSCDGCCSNGSCCSGSCGSFDGWMGCGLLGDCCLGDAWTLKDHLGCKSECWNFGGWVSGGYHDDSDDLFNSHPDQFNVHQAWVYLERVAKPTECAWDWGFRGDILYGVDAQDTQAFGNNPGEWDFLNGFDHGIYGWAIPQLYGELAYGDWSVKGGHFFTPAGYEVVAATGNFFYSHTITHYLSEPFTHTGVLGTYNVSDNFKAYSGWTLGWDTGFDQFDDGSIWIGGFSATVYQDVTFSYISTIGSFGARGDDANSHHFVVDTKLTDNLKYVLSSDILRVDETAEDTAGLVNYLLYTVNDCVGVGTRLEWWKGDVITGYAPYGSVLPLTGNASYYSATAGVNYRPHANVVVRPELRFDWSPALDYDETVFGVDAVVTF
jgi:hypothetical protein